MQRTVHIILTTHWDREWIQSFEQYRYRLVRLFDAALDILERETDLTFVADGQTIMLEAGWAARLKREHDYSTLMGTKAGASLERVFEIDGVDDSSVDTLELYTQENGAAVNRSVLIEPDPFMGRLNAVGHFVDCLTKGAQCISPGTDGLRIMKILDAAYKSAATGKAVNVS